MTVFGLFHGLVFLPVLLSYVGVQSILTSTPSTDNLEEPVALNDVALQRPVPSATTQSAAGSKSVAGCSGSNDMLSSEGDDSDYGTKSDVSDPSSKEDTHSIENHSSDDAGVSV